MKRFKDRVVIITGAGSGIGEGLALVFSREEAIVVLVGRTKEKLNKVKKRIDMQGGRSIVQLCDISQEKQVLNAVNNIFKKLKRIDILINDAGILSSLSKAEELTQKDWKKALSINLTGTFLFSKYCGRRMIKQKAGKIVNISSLHAFATYPLRTDYSVSKTAVSGLTRSLALEWGKYGINVNCIAPGQVRTKAVQSIIDAGKLDIKKIEGRTPLGKIAEIEDIIGPVCFLASDESRHITGQTLIIDGGYLINAAP